ncbi:right-handed parallel beta-helix repeat-containing protein [Belliella pelovolcani]|uniref:Right handed beta helix region n=1 Tax=Belliella pelovolcani TaxID=529505 RepID=A0A1N7LRD0_9BACT|nr:right-handed parallel beta-helix repeat-containing protein [Belliella pelovolcani]SIS76396.1 Right handed beta helix region [Belliella pelovolcani]
MNKNPQITVLSMKTKVSVCIVILLLYFTYGAEAIDYYFHPKTGNDLANGTSEMSPFKSLGKLGELKLEPGDRILLAAGEEFTETLSIINVHGSFEHPILIDSYQNNGTTSIGKAIINARGLLNGVFVSNSSHIIIRSLEISANGPLDDIGYGEMRVGVMLLGIGNDKIQNIHLQDLNIKNVFHEKEGVSRSQAEVRSANGTQKYGWGIRLVAQDNSEIEQIEIRNSRIENVSHTGIKLTGTQRQNIRNIRIYDNEVTRTGGPGIQMSGVKFVHVKGNDVSYSGSEDDSRKWGRGSGLWTWSASYVMIEHNRFTHANGPGDSAGAHIDFNCDNVILQYNFSAENAGGFCEILGNNYNCAYRYNISVNDGHRIKGENGAFQEGKIFWLSGYQGEQKPRKGPINSYFYNNTIYVKPGQTSKIAVDNGSNGLLIVNNIFHLEGPVEFVAGDQYKPDESKGDKNLQRVLFENNLFLHSTNWPKNSMLNDQKPLFGSARFKNAGGLDPQDYIPLDDVVTKGIPISFIPGDDFGLMSGLEMNQDFLTNPIDANPSIGAIKFINN